MKLFEWIHSFNFQIGIKQAFIAGFFVFLGAFIAGHNKPGRYEIIEKHYPNFDIFDTATGKIYYWRGAEGLKDIDDPINNRIINVINREHKEYLPTSK